MRQAGFELWFSCSGVGVFICALELTALFLLLPPPSSLAPSTTAALSCSLPHSLSLSLSFSVVAAAVFPALPDLV